MPGYRSIWRETKPNASFKRDLAELVSAFSERAPWQLARRILEVYGVPVAQGWEKTLSDIAYLPNERNVDIDGLYRALVAHLCCAEKSIQFYEVSSANIDALKKFYEERESKLEDIDAPKTKMQILGRKITDPSLEAIVRQDDCIFALYKSIRKRDEQIEIEYDELPEEAQEAFSSYDEIIAVRSVYFQAYSSIRVPNNGRVVEILCDRFPEDNQKSNAEFHQIMYSGLHDISKSTNVIPPIELFSAVKNIYNSKSEGMVTALSFVTTTGSVKSEKMRSKESLRAETYHVGGKEALHTEIEPFRLGVRWNAVFPGMREPVSPELYLDGTLSMVGSLTPGLNRAKIHRSASFADFEMIRDKLFQHL